MSLGFSHPEAGSARSGCRLDVEGDDETYLLGSREDQHDGLEILSSESPMGRAILGHGVGETVTFTTPTGAELEVTVTAIRTP